VGYGKYAVRSSPQPIAATVVAIDCVDDGAQCYQIYLGVIVYNKEVIYGNIQQQSLFLLLFSVSFYLSFVCSYVHVRPFIRCNN